MTRFRAALAALSLCAITQASVAQAADSRPCVTGAEAAALFVYVVPPTIQAVGSSCEGRLRPDGFMATGSRTLSARYAALQDESWPRAKRAALALFSMANGKAQTGSGQGMGMDPARIFENLPDDVARPLGDALIMQKVAEQVKPEKCGQIELVLSAMSPIEPREAGALLGAVANLVGMENLRVCKVD
ncbi:hypothetical protein H0274_04610 [Altererythrobacter sp. CC-YST694]|uniref:hypothetical protein n=1 Tax=Altererythrobacter sp. CC-YST694 TaxID=2755038 RepID=UPI001D013740|nr:hypothetical protein [Altererythrobacter sp. CC-YST694]MCB5424530.1 hypothetical protein [Altererythrobacter sp. CC-YST694]